MNTAPVMLTPKPGPAPRINGPKVYGCLPGHPFPYRIPCMGLTGEQNVRDLWRQKDLGKFAVKFESAVSPHGVVLVRIGSTVCG